MNTLHLYTTLEAARLTAAPTEAQITYQTKAKETRKTAIINLTLPDTSAVPSQFRPLVEASLQATAKAILARILSTGSVWPTEIDAAYFAHAALISGAMPSNWVKSDDLKTWWSQSATLTAWQSRADWATNKALRRQVEEFSELVLKLSAKNATLTETQAERVLSKLQDADLSSDEGEFIARRIEQILSKAQEMPADTDLL